MKPIIHLDKIKWGEPVYHTVCGLELPKGEPLLPVVHIDNQNHSVSTANIHRVTCLKCKSIYLLKNMK